MIRTKAPQNLNPPITCYDGETFWGHGIEYMSRTTTQAKVKFFLHDRVDTFHRLVIKIKSEEKEEMEYDATVEDFSPLGEQLQTSVEMVSINNSPYVAVAWAHVELDKSGSVSLVYGPPVDTIELGPEGGTFEFSRNPGVKLSATTSQGTIPERTKINMQVTKAPPLNHPPPPESSAGESGEAAEARVSTQPVVAMTDFLHLRGPSSLADSTQLSLRATLPLSEQFSKEQSQAFVFVRQNGQTKENVEEEMKEWTPSPEIVTLKRDVSNVVISATMNQMATVVQGSKDADVQDVRREVAKQHIKAGQVAVQFYVREKKNQNQSVKNGNSSSSKTCRLEITVKAKEEGSCNRQPQDKSDNYKVSDIVYVPPSLRMRIWLHQENFESSLTSGDIVFQYGVHTEPIGNYCWFEVSRQETTQTRIILKIEKSKLLEQCGQMSWKPLIDLEVCIPPFKTVSSSPEPETPVNETFDVPVDDQLLSHLARRIPPTEVYRLGIELQLDSCFVENIFHSSHAHDYFTKCFMILRAARDSCRLPKDFVELLRAALTGLQLISQLEWLLRELRKRKESEPQWDHFSTLPVI
ncbi:hypothetical protein C0Q70_16320 [Pomacea canaliculata]|uniref:Uncharacterized protein n=1 Tax=Pomacea canaliculata TaxID=400727 RepID=A0A2T7NPG3_POMCA|nr:hypothetical protein C0Q70_16320 [Pomacea canaliculata]